MANEIQPTRQDTWLITVHVEDVWTKAAAGKGIMADFGVFDKMTGGAKQAQASTYRPGGMADPISLGAVPTVTNVVVSRNARIIRDLQNSGNLLKGVGISKMTVSRMPLDFEGNVVPGVAAVVYTGKLD